jgi:hypothetical protein
LVQVSTTTTGEEIDPDGYVVTLDGGQVQSIAVNGTVTYTGVAAGDHIAELLEAAATATLKIRTRGS